MNKSERATIDRRLASLAVTRQIKRRCPECGRIFDMLNETDSAEWAYGHDCEGEG